MNRTFDRVPRFDPRSRQHPIRTLIPSQRKLRSFTWSCSVCLDQGVEGACVGHGWAHEIAARPRPMPVTSADAFGIYHRAKEIDEYEGVDYDGTSVLAGAKAVRERKQLAEFRWAFGLDDALLALGYKGPGVAGLNWYADMFAPDAQGFLHPSGELLGGHCVLVNAVSVRLERVMVWNSWGPEWGIGGHAYLSFRDFGRLLDQDGEFCVPVIR